MDSARVVHSHQTLSGIRVADWTSVGASGERARLAVNAKGTSAEADRPTVKTSK